MGVFKKTNPRRSQVRRNLSADRIGRLDHLVNTDVVTSVLIWLLFVAVCVPILAFEFIREARYVQLGLTAIIVIVASAAGGSYIRHYQKRILRNHTRAASLATLFAIMLAATKLGVLLSGNTHWATGGAVITAIILAIAYDQRFAIGMSVFYCVLGAVAAGPDGGSARIAAENELTGLSLLLTMLTGSLTCCFALAEIRTRMKLINVSVATAGLTFISAGALGMIREAMGLSEVLAVGAYHGVMALLMGLLMQSLLPVIEKAFRIATSMTLLDHSDANQPLLKRLAMEAPGTFSHSLMIGTIAEAAAEAIGRNGLLCRVGAYYHDIGKINKPRYFVENEMGAASRHKELSPAMSQLIIVGHVKDGIEMAKEYGLPAVLRQFIETHHGTTLVVPFYAEAIKKHDSPVNKGRKPKEAPPSESEFRYAGPKPRTKEAGIVMIADAAEGAVRALREVTPTKIESVVHSIAMKRLQDGQFDECDLSLRELSQIVGALSKALASHYHGRIAYPQLPENGRENGDSGPVRADRKAAGSKK